MKCHDNVALNSEKWQLILFLQDYVMGSFDVCVRETNFLFEWARRRDLSVRTVLSGLRRATVESPAKLCVACHSYSDVLELQFVDTLPSVPFLCVL